MTQQKRGSKTGLVVAGAGLAAGAAWLLTRKTKAADPGLANVFGIISDSVTGNPIAGVQILLITNTFSNQAGNYSFMNVEPGSYTITFSKTGYEEGSMAIEVVEGNNELNIDLVPSGAPPATTVLFGIVADANTGQPIPGVQVVMGGVGRETDGQGRYRFEGEWLVPGEYSITFTKDGYETLTL